MIRLFTDCLLTAIGQSLDEERLSIADPGILHTSEGGHAKRDLGKRAGPVLATCLEMHRFVFPENIKSFVLDSDSSTYQRDVFSLYSRYCPEKRYDVLREIVGAHRRRLR